VTEAETNSSGVLKRELHLATMGRGLGLGLIKIWQFWACWACGVGRGKGLCTPAGFKAYVIEMCLLFNIITFYYVLVALK